MKKPSKKQLVALMKKAKKLAETETMQQLYARLGREIVKLEDHTLRSIGMSAALAEPYNSAIKVTLRNKNEKARTRRRR